MRSLCFLLLAFTLSVSSSAERVATEPALRSRLQITPVRIVIGSLADVSVRYENGKPLTVIHMLEFRTDVFPKEPELLQVRLCEDQGGRIRPAVHTNITLTYNPASQSRLTGCLSLISVEPWQDTSEWQTVTFNPNPVKRSVHLEKYIQGIIDGAFAH